MSTLQKYICLLALVGLAACAPATAQVPPVPTAPAATPTVEPTATESAPAPMATPTSPAAPAHTLLIQYHRSGGIAGLDETWLFYADGVVDHAGRGQGRATQLSASQLAALMAVVRSPEVAALKESYVPANTCCDRFLHEITLTLDGQTKSVRTLDAAPDQPPALTSLLEAINNALQ
jgi:hypothetical protein